MVFSLNVHSQSEKLKELQQTLEYWQNFPFELYVLERDKDEVSDLALVGSSGRLVGIYPDKGNSIDKPRVYSYTIKRFVPLIGDWVYDKEKFMTIDSKYSKSEYEDHKKSKIENVFKQIDEQLELEKKQKEVRNATAERKRKRDDYVKNQIELIENKKDSIIIEIDREKKNLKRWNDEFTKIKLELIPFLNFHKGDTIVKRNNGFRFSYGIDNSLLGFPSKQKWSSLGYGGRRTTGGLFFEMIQTIPSFQIYENLELFKKEFVYITGTIEEFTKYIDSNSKSFDEVKDEWDGRYSNGLSDNIFNERLLRSYRTEIFKAENEGYDYVYSPLVWKGQRMKSHTEKFVKALNKFYANQNYIERESSPGYTDLLIKDVKLVSDYMQGSKMASKFLVWYQKVFPSGSETYRRRKVEKFLNCTRNESLSTLINSCFELNGGKIDRSGNVFSFINEIVPTGTWGLLENIDYNNLNECLEELY